MVSAGGLDVRVVLVETQIDESRSRFVVPVAGPVPELGGAGLEGHSIDGHPEPPSGGGDGLFGRAGTERHAEIILLRRNRIWVAAIGKFAWRMVGQAIAPNETLASGDGDGNAVGSDLRRRAFRA